MFYCICRCESCHGQAERLLDSAKEMEDSIAVNLRFGCCFDVLDFHISFMLYVCIKIDIQYLNPYLLIVVKVCAVLACNCLSFWFDGNLHLKAFGFGGNFTWYQSLVVYLVSHFSILLFCMWAIVMIT